MPYDQLEAELLARNGLPQDAMVSTEGPVDMRSLFWRLLSNPFARGPRDIQLDPPRPDVSGAIDNAAKGTKQLQDMMKSFKDQNRKAAGQ